MPGSTHTTAKAIIALLLIVGAIGWTAYRSRTIMTGGSANNGVTGEFPGEDRERFRTMAEEAAKHAGLTAEQRSRLEKAREQAMQSGDWASLREITSGILTQEQQQKMREFREQQRQQRMAERAKQDARLKASMTEEEWKRYEEKRAERRRQFGGRGPGGGPRGNGGGPPGAGPGNTRSHDGSRQTNDVPRG